MSGNELHDYYDHDYHRLRHPMLLSDEEYFWSRARASAELNLGPVSKEARILEYGCGLGQNIALVPGAVGYDPSTDAVRACAKRNIPVFDTVKDIPKSYYDVVLCRHVLEHVPSPLEALEVMRSVLRPSGLLILILPREKHRHPVSFDPDLNQHLYCWNFRTIDNLLALARYRVILNKVQYVVGYRRLLPLKRWLGYKAYYYGTLAAGRLCGVSELVIHAQREE